MTITVQVLCSESSQEARLVVAAQVKEAIRAVTMDRIRGLAVEPQDGMFVLNGCCNAFHLRKDAIDTANLIIDEAVDKELIPDATLIDLIEVY